MITKKIMNSIVFIAVAVVSGLNATITVEVSIMPSAMQKAIINAAKKLVPKLKKLPLASQREVFNSIILPFMSFVIKKDVQTKSKEDMQDLVEKIQELEQNQTPEAKDFINLFQESAQKAMMELMQTEPATIESYFKSSLSQGNEMFGMTYIQFQMPAIFGLLAYDAWYDALIATHKTSFIQLFDSTGIVPANKRKTALPTPKELLEFVPEMISTLKEMISAQIEATAASAKENKGGKK
jgi:hypothetical protein